MAKIEPEKSGLLLLLLKGMVLASSLFVAGSTLADGTITLNTWESGIPFYS